MEDQSHGRGEHNIIPPPRIGGRVDSLVKAPKRSWGRYPSSGSLFPSPHPTLALAALSSPSPQAASCLHYLLGRSDMMALVAHGGWLDPHPSLLLS